MDIIFNLLFILFIQSSSLNKDIKFFFILFCFFFMCCTNSCHLSHVLFITDLHILNIILHSMSHCILETKMATLFEQSISQNTRCFACGSLVYAVEKKLTTNHVDQSFFSN
jgi:hypothetical protein